ncbi:MAG: DUF89 family protein [Ruminococcaceae bacterium]|nr:DUF89 family protein [Oscillospiraceae bacterium]
MPAPLLHPECVSCLIKKQIDIYPKSASREQVLTYMRRLGELMATLPDRTGGPAIMEAITDIRREVFGSAAALVERDYGTIKAHFNRLMMDFVASEGLLTRIWAAEDPLRAALGYAMTGNFIDFGAMDSVDEEKLRALLGSAAERVEAADPVYLSLRETLSTARRLTFLTDNCGEIVLDRLLVEVLRALYPDLAITVLVRGGEVLNDATMEDALQAGFDRVEGVCVMGNGDRLAGTDVDRVSPEAREALTAADLILAKGQGNYETLRGCGLPVFYVFLCKCRFFADRFGVPTYTGMLVKA